MILVGTLGIFSGLNTPMSLFCIALGAFFTVFPWMHHHLRSQVDRISEEQSLFCLSLGMSSYDYLKLFLWPQLRPAIMRIALLISLWSLGEYTFSKALLNRSSTLSLFIEENLRRYQFADAGVALSLSLLLSAIVVTPLLWKGDKRVAL
jgi:ABC-type Fe3+ transport system permease subunit